MEDLGKDSPPLGLTFRRSFVHRRADPMGRTASAFFKEEIGKPIEALHNKEHHVCLHFGLDLDEREQEKVALTYSPGEYRAVKSHAAPPGCVLGEKQLR